jgi:hypothetical protein
MNHKDSSDNDVYHEEEHGEIIRLLDEPEESQGDEWTSNRKNRRNIKTDRLVTLEIET